jgi:glycosyltransferase involved in cell wall biosynthesis
MRILLIADLLIRNYDGCNRTIFNLIDRLKNRKGTSLYVIANKIEGLDHSIPRFHVNGLKIPGSQDYYIAIPAFMEDKLEKIISEFKPDVVHVTTPSILGLYYAKLAKLMDIPVSTIYHTNFISYVDHYLQNSIFKSFFAKLTSSIYRSFYNRCNKILCPSNSMKKQLQEIGVNKNQLTIMTRGIDKNIFHPPTKKDKFLAKHFLNDYVNLIFTSRLVWEKNVEMLIKISQYIDSYNLPYNITIIGDGPAMEKMKETMPKAYFTGGIDQISLANHLRSADIFVFPSVSETYGNVLMEAIACNLMVVAAEGGANIDIVTSDEYGYLVSPYDEVAYVDAIQKTAQLIKEDKVTHLHTHQLIKSWDEINDDFIRELKSIVDAKRNIA